MNEFVAVAAALDFYDSYHDSDWNRLRVYLFSKPLLRNKGGRDQILSDTVLPLYTETINAILKKKNNHLSNFLPFIQHCFLKAAAKLLTRKSPKADPKLLLSLLGATQPASHCFHCK